MSLYLKIFWVIITNTTHIDSHSHWWLEVACASLWAQTVNNLGNFCKLVIREPIFKNEIIFYFWLRYHKMVCYCVHLFPGSHSVTSHWKLDAGWEEQCKRGLRTHNGGEWGEGLKIAISYLCLPEIFMWYVFVIKM